MELILNSNRVYEDLTLAIDFPNIFNVKIAIREWIDNTNLDHEFRTFVYQRKITAICQYCDIIYFPQLVKYKDEIQRRIVQLFDTVKNILPFDNCIIDFAVVLDKNKTFIVEINPYLHTTGAGLFSWYADKDILEGKKDEIEFRIHTEEPLTEEQLENMLFPNWESVVEEALKQTDISKKKECTLQ